MLPQGHDRALFKPALMLPPRPTLPDSLPLRRAKGLQVLRLRPDLRLLKLGPKLPTPPLRHKRPRHKRRLMLRNLLRQHGPRAKRRVKVELVLMNRLWLASTTPRRRHEMWQTKLVQAAQVPLKLPLTKLPGLFKALAALQVQPLKLYNKRAH